MGAPSKYLGTNPQVYNKRQMWQYAMQMLGTLATHLPEDWSFAFPMGVGLSHLLDEHGLGGSRLLS